MTDPILSHAGYTEACDSYNALREAYDLMEAARTQTYDEAIPDDMDIRGYLDDAMGEVAARLEQLEELMDEYRRHSTSDASRKRYRSVAT